MQLNFGKPGQVVKERRQQRGFSLAQLAEQLGVSKSLLSMVESGKRAMPDEQLPILARLLDLPDELLRVAVGRLPPDVERRLPEQAFVVTTAVRQAAEDRAVRFPTALSQRMRRRLTTTTATPQVPDRAIVDRFRAGKNSTAYRAHSYHTKVPPEAIQPLIEHYTMPGDVVLDPFCGSGMTGVAAIACGRHAVLSDVSPASAHIARNYASWCDPEAFESAVERIHAAINPTITFLYDTPDGDTVEHTVWSDVFACPSCAKRWSYWDATRQRVGKQAGPGVRCPACKAEHPKKDLWWVGELPVVSSTSRNGQGRSEHPPTDAELQLISQAESAPIPYWTPQAPFDRTREMWRASHEDMGIKTVSGFFTRRNLHALAAIRHAILQEQDQRLRDALLFAFTGCVNRASKRYQWNAKRPTNVMTGTLYVSSLRYEWNVWSLFSRKAADVRRYYEAFPQTGTEVEVVLSSATDLNHVPDHTIDFVFMDPPFGSNIFYADSSLLWEAWLGHLTLLADEIVVNQHVKAGKGGKSIGDYSDLLAQAFAEVRRVLKPGAHAVLAFSNTDDRVWEAIRAALNRADLDIVDTSILDKVQRSIKGVQGELGNERVTRLDLLIMLRARPVGAPRPAGRPAKSLDALVAEVLGSSGSAERTIDAVYADVLRRALEAGMPMDGLSMAQVEAAIVLAKPLAASMSAGPPQRTSGAGENLAASATMANDYLCAGASFELGADGSAPKVVPSSPRDAVPGARNSAVYTAHSYHTKVPPEAITPFIEHFTRPGDIVLDPFAGSGMTGVATALAGRRCILSDLSVVSRHLAYNHTRPCDANRLAEAFESMYERLLPRFKEWYRTVDRDGTPGYVYYTIWSKGYSCPSCQHRFSMWSITDTESGRVGRTLACPKCSFEASRQSWRAEENLPAHISYSTPTGSRDEKAVDASDLAHIFSFTKADIAAWFPTTPVDSRREMYIRSALHLQGIQTVADFYTPRNLLALATIWQEIVAVADERLRFALAFAFTNTAWHGTRMRRYNARGGQRPLTGTLYIPQLSSEANVLEVMKNKIAQLCTFYREFEPSRDVPPPLIRAGSATDLVGIPDASVDYVFTDPPFGSNIFYADCNLIWEAWLGAITDDALEAVVNRSKKASGGGKSVLDYQCLMTDALREIHRVLKPGGWLTLVFHNTDANVWAALQAAAANAGFEVDSATGLDRKQQSHKGYKGRSGEEQVAHFDVVLSMQKKGTSTGPKKKSRAVSDERLREILAEEARRNDRVNDSAQWAHSIAIRRLLDEGYDLRDVSYGRVLAIWQGLQNTKF
jgi:DNA modification methylase/transcriptional regulator with XRE-family HTH domain